MSKMKPEPLEPILTYILELGFNVKLLHWSTSRLTEHLLLDRLADKAEETADLFTESYQGRYGVRINPMGIPQLTRSQKAFASKLDTITYLRGEFAKLQEIIEDLAEQADLQDILVDLSKELSTSIFHMSLD